MKNTQTPFYDQDNPPQDTQWGLSELKRHLGKRAAINYLEAKAGGFTASDAVGFATQEAADRRERLETPLTTR